MIKRLFLFCISAVYSITADATIYQNANFRFSIILPNDMILDDNGEGNCLFFASNKNHRISTFAYKAPVGYKYRIKDMIENTNIPENATRIESKKYAPFYNLLRHSIIQTYQLGPKTYVKELVTQRHRTRFIIRFYSSNNDFSWADEIINSVNIGLTHRGNFLLAKNNLGWFWGSVFLSLFPLIGFHTGKLLRKWKHSCGIDKSSLRKSIFCIIFTIGLLTAEFIMLKDDMILAAIIMSIMVIFHLSFAFGNKFIASVYDELFGI